VPDHKQFPVHQVCATTSWHCSSAVGAGGRTKAIAPRPVRTRFDAGESSHAASRRLTAASMNRRRAERLLTARLRRSEQTHHAPRPLPLRLAKYQRGSASAGAMASDLWIAASMRQSDAEIETIAARPTRPRERWRAACSQSQAKHQRWSTVGSVAEAHKQQRVRAWRLPLVPGFPAVQGETHALLVERKPAGDRSRVLAVVTNAERSPTNERFLSWRGGAAWLSNACVPRFRCDAGLRSEQGALLSSFHTGLKSRLVAGGNLTLAARSSFRARV
jgi:hypothetical protein